MLGKEQERVEIFVACELFSVAHTGGKVLPGNNRFDRREGIAGLLPGGDQCATNSWIISLIALPCSANVLSYLSFDFVKKLPMSRSCRSRASGNAIV